MIFENGWFRENVANSCVRLLIFPHAGSTALSYKQLLKALPQFVEGWVYEYPGHGFRSSEPLVSSVSGIVSQCTPPENNQGKPTIVLGHSMGAHIARAWIAQNPASTRALIVSASPSPSALGLQASTGALPSTDSEVAQHIERLGGMDKALLGSSEFMQYLLPILRNDYQVLANSCSSAVPKLAVRIYGIFGQSDTLTCAETGSWNLETLCGYHERRVSGGHFYWISSTETLIQTITEVFGDVISN